MNNWLLHKFKQYGTQPALIVGGKTFSYADFVHACDQLEATHKFKSGSVLYVKGGFGLYTVATLCLALTKQIVVVPVSLQSWVNVARFFDVLPANVIFDCHEVSALPKITNLNAKAFDNSLCVEILNSKHSALILYSSGTTGQPKAAVHDFSVFIDKFNNCKKQFCSEVFLDFDHIGGLNALFSTLSAGGTVVVPDSTQPAIVFAAIEKYKVQLLPTTPSFLRMALMSRVFQDFDLSSLKIVAYGSEYMPDKTLHAVQQALPGVILKQTYGSTETGVLVTQSQSNDSTLLKIDSNKTLYKIVDGILWVKLSNSSFKGYLNAPFKMVDEWVNTQDRVEQDGDYIKILGRDTEMINVGGNKVDPHEIEDFLLRFDGVKDAAVYAKKSPMLGQIVVAEIAAEQGIVPEELLVKLKLYCRENLETFKIPAHFKISSDITYSARWKKERGKNE